MRRDLGQNRRIVEHAPVAEPLGRVQARSRKHPCKRLAAGERGGAVAAVVHEQGRLVQVVADRMVRLIERRERIVMAEFEPAWIGNHLSQPTLLVHDRSDRTAPLAGSEALARVLARSRLHTTEGLGHRRVLDDAAVLAEVTAHLAGAEPMTTERA